MGLDIRLPIGLLFTCIGALLSVYGIAASDHSMSQGRNVNLVWGIIIFVFGLAMLGLWKLVPKDHE